MSNVTDRLINHTQGEAIVAALQTIAQKSESPYNSSNKLNPEYIDVGTLADGMTTTTQISSDASNKLATTKYVHDITDEKQDSLTTEQLAAVNSGITAERLKNIETTLDNKANTSTTYTKTEVDTALSGKQPTLTTAQLAAINSGITDDDVEQIDLNKNNILSGFTMVAHASANGATSLSYDTNINDFNIGGANSDKSSGSYLVICTNWSTTPAPYVGLLTFSGAIGNKFVKTDIITGFAPTITITQNVANATIDISGAAKISIYATK